MDVVVKARHIEVSPALRQYAEDKIRKLSRYLSLPRAEVELSVEKNPRISANQTVEVTIHTRGPVIRGKESTEDMHASIDLVSEKLEKQIKRYKGKVHDNHSSRAHGLSPEALAAPPETLQPEEAEPGIVKTKQFAVKPMTPEEATMQMELLGHDFFVFTNSETEEINVVYRRSDENYGLIEPTAG